MKIRKLIASLLVCVMLASATAGMAVGATDADYEADYEDDAIEVAINENGENGYEYNGDYYDDEDVEEDDYYDYYANDEDDDIDENGDDEDSYEPATPISEDMVLTRRAVYTIAANFIAESIGTTITNPLAFAQEVSIGLLTANDRTRYLLETGRPFDLDSPITRQEYALIIDRMLNILRRFNIDLIRESASDELLVVRGGVQSQLTNTDRGIGIIQSRAATLTGIGTMSASFHYNPGAGRLQDIRWYADADSIRGSARYAMENILQLGVLEPKTFEEKQIFYSHIPSLDIITNRFEEISAEEFEARNEAARARFEAILLSRSRSGHQIDLERSLFTAPNDLLTVAELDVLNQALVGIGR